MIFQLAFMLYMFIEEPNFISLGKLFQMVATLYKKLRWPIAVLQRGMSSLFSLRVERPLIVPLLMNLELRLVGAIPFMHLSGSLSKSGKRNFGTKNNFPSFFVSEKGLAHIYNKAIYFFQLLIFALLRAKITFCNFGRTEVADRDQKGNIHRFFEALKSTVHFIP